jgi:predicted transcriptional regulator
MKKLCFSLLVGGLVLGLSIPAQAALLKVGSKVTAVKVKDANDKPAWTPDVGKKVLTIFYTDPDVKDMNERFREVLKAKNFSKKKYRGYGVVNLKDTWKPNFIIRKVIRGKIKKFNSTILTDPDNVFKKRWRLGNCDENDVVIIVGKDKKVKYIKKTKMSAGEIKKAVKLIEKLIAE